MAMKQEMEKIREQLRNGKGKEEERRQRKEWYGLERTVSVG